jgi:hypothetical protein
MLVIRISDSRIFASGATCSIDAKGIYSPGQFLPFNALSSGGVTPTQAQFETVATSLEPQGHYHAGFSHQWSGTAIESVPGYTPPAPPSAQPKLLGKTSGVTYNEFRSLMTLTELALLENFERDAYFSALGKTPLTTAQKATVQFLIGEARATGAPGERGINLISPKMNQGLSDIETMGILAAGRKAEIQAGIIKS